MTGAAGEQNGNRTTRSGPKPGVGPLGKLPAGDLKTRVLIGVLVGAVATVALIGLVLARASRAIQILERNQYAQLATDARVRLERLQGRDRSRLMEAAFSDELYGLVAAGAAPPDSFIRPSFVERFITQYGDQMIAVYDLSGRRMLNRVEPGGEGLGSVVAVNGFFRMLDNREATVGVIRNGDQLIWVAGAPILPTNYADQSQGIRGYLLVAQAFKPAVMAPAAGERGVRIELAGMAPPKEQFRTRVETVRGDSVQIDFAIPDVFAQQNTRASLVTGRGEFQAVGGTLRSLLWMALAGVALLGAAAWFLLMRHLVTPATKTSALLAPIHQGQVPSLISAQSSATEWTTLTSTVNRLLANGRLQVERFDRLSSAVSEGAWERDLTSGEWFASPRFKKLIGYTDADFPNPLVALKQRLDPTEGAELLGWLSAEVPPSKRLATISRVRRPGGEEASLRFEADVATDLSGTPTRITGRVVDITAERRTAAKILEAEAQVQARVRGQGDFLTGLAMLLKRDSDHRVIEHRLATIGRAISGTLDIAPEPFDLHSLMQEATDVPGMKVDLTIVPGVPPRVNGDTRRVRELIDYLVEQVDRSTGRMVVRAEQPFRETPERVRLLVEDRRPAMAEVDRVAIASILRTGEGDGDDPRLEWRLIHHLAKALGGSAGLTVEGTATQVWVELPLPGVEEPVATSVEDFATVDAGSATFAVEPAMAQEPNLVGGLATAAPVELVADATVTINLDDGAPTLTAVSDRIRDNLARGDSATTRLAKIAMGDIPTRMIELRGAVRAGESRTVANIAQAMRSIADALEAKPMANRCNDLLDAVESHYLDTAEDLLTALDQAWNDVRVTIEPFAVAQPANADRAAIDPATRDQLTATITADGTGLGNQLVTLFLAEAPLRVEGAERALAKGDLGAVRSGVADLKSMCALVGATALADVSTDLAAETDLAAAQDKLTALKSEYRRVQEALEPLLGVRVSA